MVVRCAGNIPKDIPSPAILAMQESTLHQRRQVASAQLKHQDKDPCTQPSEPILFPKLRICFADFPYLLCSIDQRPWRPDAVMGTTRGVNKSILRLFKGS